MVWLSLNLPATTLTFSLSRPPTSSPPGTARNPPPKFQLDLMLSLFQVKVLSPSAPPKSVSPPPSAVELVGVVTEPIPMFLSSTSRFTESIIVVVPLNVMLPVNVWLPLSTKDLTAACDN